MLAYSIETPADWTPSRHLTIRLCVKLSNLQIVQSKKYLRLFLVFLKTSTGLLVVGKLADLGFSWDNSLRIVSQDCWKLKAA